MLYNNYEMRILVKGRPVTEYSHNGQIFIEGRDGSTFELEFKNKTGLRVEAVFSVDGLSIIDGKEAGPQSQGYLVNGYETIRIPGWKITDSEAASFVFAGKKTSYATQMTGSSRNNGVIGVMVFAEKPKPIMNSIPYGILRSNGYPVADMPFGSVSTTLATSGAIGQYTASLNSTECMSASPYDTARSYAKGAVSMNMVQLTASGAAPIGSASQTAKNQSAEVEIKAQNLGTGFGSAADFKTTLVDFDRGDLSAMIVLYYDDARGLKSRGIQILKASKAKLAETPQAFPGMNCQPPPGWKG